MNWLIQGLIINAIWAICVLIFKYLIKLYFILKRSYKYKFKHSNHIKHNYSLHESFLIRMIALLVSFCITIVHYAITHTINIFPWLLIAYSMYLVYEDFKTAYDESIKNITYF